MTPRPPLSARHLLNVHGMSASCTYTSTHTRALCSEHIPADKIIYADEAYTCAYAEKFGRQLHYNKETRRDRGRKQSRQSSYLWCRYLLSIRRRTWIINRTVILESTVHISISTSIQHLIAMARETKFLIFKPISYGLFKLHSFSNIRPLFSLSLNNPTKYSARQRNWPLR
jgi:hypothetical protein